MVTLNPGGEQKSATGLTHSPSQKPSTFSVLNRLTPSEEDWLRQNLKETIEQARQILAQRKREAA